MSKSRLPILIGIPALAVAAVVFAATLSGFVLPSGQAEAQNAGATETQPGGQVPGGALGQQSDSVFWRQIREGGQFSVSIPDRRAAVLVQSEGDNWRAFRNGPLSNWGGSALGVTVGLIAIFYFLRGRIRIESGRANTTIQRFSDLERFGHWLLAVSFIILGLSGLNILYGKYVLLPLVGPEAFAMITQAGKWLHNYVAFAFMAGLALVFVLWVRHNFPRMVDFLWVLKGGGLLVKGSHPPAHKFNAGQKLVFWAVILLGLSLSMSGIALLFPFQTTMFEKTFVALNMIGFELPTGVTPMQEMQFAQLWHSMVAIALIAVVIAHIYIGSLGMEGAFDAMGTGDVDRNWAKEHHSLWVADLDKADSAKSSGG